MLNGKNVRTQRAARKLDAKLFRPFQVVKLVDRSGMSVELELYVLWVYVSLLPTRQLAFYSCYWLQQYTATCSRYLSFSLQLLLPTPSCLATQLPCTTPCTVPCTSPSFGVSRTHRVCPMTFCGVTIVGQTRFTKHDANTEPLQLGQCYTPSGLPHEPHRQYRA